MFVSKLDPVSALAEPLAAAIAPHLKPANPALARALAQAEVTRREAGFLREEYRAALLAAFADAESPQAALDAACAALDAAGFTPLADALRDHVAEHTGLRAFAASIVAHVSTAVFDLKHAGLFLATGAPDHEGHYADGTWRSWTGEYTVSPATFLTPKSEAEVSAILAGTAPGTRVRAVGAGHCFNEGPLCVDTMISLNGMHAVLGLDRASKTVRVAAGIRLRDLNRALWDLGLGLPVLGSTDAQSVAGLIATDVHGTGRDHGFLSERLVSLRVLDAAGQARTVRPGDPLFHAVVGGAGTCGIVTEVEVQAVDRFHLEKRVAMVDRAYAEAEIDTLLRENDHLSFYYVGGAADDRSVRMHTWNRTEAPLSPNWHARKVRAELSDLAIAAWAPGVAEILADVDADSPISNVLSPDLALVMPGSVGFGRKLFYRHDELEYGVPYAGWREAVAEIMALLRDRDAFSIVEVRFTPDMSQALLGPGVGRRTAYIELATPLSTRDADVNAAAERILLRHGGQPHLGKKTSLCAPDLQAIFGDRYLKFQAVRRMQDPHGKFLNPFTDRLFGEPV